MALQFHECDRFRARGMSCPFEEMDEDDDDDEEQDKLFPPLAIPARKRRDGDLANNLSQFPVVAHGDPQMKEALERMAAIQNEGGLQSIPNLIPSLPFQGRGHPEIISILAAIAIMSTLKALRSTGLGKGFQAVKVSETRVARGLSKLGGIGGSAVRPGPPAGGGLHMRAPTFRGPLPSPKVSKGQDNELRRLLGFRGPLAGFDEFSETGF